MGPIGQHFKIEIIINQVSDRSILDSIQINIIQSYLFICEISQKPGKPGYQTGK